MIKIKLEKVHRGLIFQILECPEQIRMMKTFIASNDFSISSINSPEISRKAGRIYLVGDMDECDNIVTVEKFLCNDERDECYNQIVQALTEFTKSSHYKKLVEKPSKPATVAGPNIYSFDNGNMVIRLELAVNGIIFQILKCPEQLRGNLENTKTFGGYTFKSVGKPELRDSSTGPLQIFLWGVCTEGDNDVVILPEPPTIASKIHHEIISAFDCFTKSDEYLRHVHPTTNCNDCDDDHVLIFK